MPNRMIAVANAMSTYSKEAKLRILNFLQALSHAIEISAALVAI
jgi:hypothetical protein